jgi:tetratricopeptide (TPR) repeat protein
VDEDEAAAAAGANELHRVSCGAVTQFDRQQRNRQPLPVNDAIRGHAAAALTLPRPVLRMPRILLVVTLILAAAPSLYARADADLEAGFAALEAGDGSKAATLFRRALADDPKHPAALYGAGVAAHLQGRDIDAKSWLKQALAVEPRLSAASALLGDILYHEGELTAAIKTYETALTYAPGEVFFRERLAAWRSEATVHDGLQAYKDDRFTILFSGPANRILAERATTVLRDSFWKIGQWLGSFPSNPINVVLYTDKQFRDITGAPEWAGAGFDGQIRMPVGGATKDLREFDRVLIHELTHAMLASIATRNVPAWLNEGLAMFFEGNDAAASEKLLASARLYVPLGYLEGGFTRLSAEQAALAYEVSAFATSALITKMGAGNLRFFLQDLDRGLTTETAVERYGFTFAEFEAGLAKRLGATKRQP